MKGKLIVIEGTDGSGKNTQTKLLVDKLNIYNKKSEMISFPRYETPTGKIVGECYLGKDLGLNTGSLFEDPVNLDPYIASLYYAADRRAAVFEIKEKLANGINLICDRYVESNIAHQSAKLEEYNERNNLFYFINKLEYELLELPKPDKIIFLFMPFKVAKKLKENMKQKLDAHESNENHLLKSEEIFLNLSQGSNWKRINCSYENEPRSIEDINNEIFEYVSKLLKK